MRHVPERRTALGPSRPRAALLRAGLTVVALVAALGVSTGLPAAATVPPATGNNAVITVKVGGDRTGMQITDTSSTNFGIAPLAGTVLGLYSTAASTTALFTCTSDAQGDCSFIIPNTQVGGANRDRQYFVKQISAPAGWTRNLTLRTGGASATPSSSTQYAFQTGVQLRAGVTYSSLTDFMYMPATVANQGIQTSSSGVWQQSRVNPTLTAGCGLSVAVLVDLSSSIGAAQPQMLAAIDTLVDSFTGTPSRMAIFSFGSRSPSNLGANYPDLMSVSTAAGAAAFKAQYANWQVQGGTNWDEGFYQTAAATPHYDLTIVLTDGNPSYYGNPWPPNASSNFNRFKENEYAIFSANMLKAEGTRVVAMGVGSGVTGNGALNLAAVSGPTAYTGSNALTADYFQVSDYTLAGNALRQLAEGVCSGTMTVVKQIAPASTTGEDVTGATLAPAGWSFSGTTTTAGIGGLPATKVTSSDGTGAVVFPLTFPGGTTSAAVNVRETQQTGYQIVTQAGKNASCVNATTGVAVTVTNDNTNPATPGFSAAAPSAGRLVCTIYNRPLTTDLTVDKTWVVNGTTFANGAQPSDLSAQLQLTGPGAAGASDQAWGATRTGYARGSTATVTESTSLGSYSHCATSAAVTRLNGAAVNIPLTSSGYQVTLNQASTTVGVTNTVTCSQRLTLVKDVAYGPLAASTWTLSATPPAGGGALPGPSGSHSATTPVSAAVTPLVPYTLAETGGPGTYLPTGPWTCALTADPATAVSVVDAQVAVPRGQDVTCTITNSTATITLLKHVIDPVSGFAADNWNLTATPAALAGVSLPTETRPGAETDVAGANTFAVRPGHTYTLTESSVSDTLAYRQVGLQRWNGTAWVDVTSAQISAPAAGSTAIYRFVNERIPPVMLPLTGGIGADVFSIGGGLLLAIALILVAVTARRRKTMR